MQKVDLDKITPVFALEIATVSNIVDGQSVIYFVENPDYNDPIVVTEEYIKKYSPRPGGLYIACSNGVGLYSEA